VIHNSIKEEKMTQKELCYVEDATEHEGNIIKIIKESIKQLQDEKLISFMEEELVTHENMKEKLLNLLEEKSYE